MSNAFKLKPAVKSYIWGGQYFQQFGKSDLDVVAELWELSARGVDSSVICSGNHIGKRLDEVISPKMLGPHSERFSYFPLLIKLIDAKQNLSVQVHPSDEYALKYEHSFGKSEMWHIISCDEHAGLYIGFKQDSSKEEIEKRLKDGTILEALNFVEVKPGETYLINPGTIHAIGKGVRLIEIQQNSDLTYRLFDYNRVGVDGKPRQLHIEKALDVIDYKKYAFNKNPSFLLADTPYFKVQRIEIKDKLTLKANGGSFMSFTFIKGNGFVDDVPYQQFDTFFLPNGEECEIKGESIIILSEV